MPNFWKKLRATVPGAFLAALILGALFLVFVASDQSHWWRVKQDYTFGWLVPLFVMFVVHDRWGKIIAALNACTAAHSPRAAGGQKWLLGFAVSVALLFGVFMFLLGAFFRASSGPSQPGTL